MSWAKVKKINANMDTTLDEMVLTQTLAMNISSECNNWVFRSKAKLGSILNTYADLGDAELAAQQTIQEIVVNQSSMDSLCNSLIATQSICNSSVALRAIGESILALNTVFTTEVAYSYLLGDGAKVGLSVLGESELAMSIFVTHSNHINFINTQPNSAAMIALAESENAMNYLAKTETSRNILKDNNVIKSTEMPFCKFLACIIGQAPNDFRTMSDVRPHMNTIVANKEALEFLLSGNFDSNITFLQETEIINKIFVDEKSESILHGVKNNTILFGLMFSNNDYVDKIIQSTIILSTLIGYDKFVDELFTERGVKVYSRLEINSMNSLTNLTTVAITRLLDHSYNSLYKRTETMDKIGSIISDNLLTVKIADRFIYNDLAHESIKNIHKQAFLSNPIGNVAWNVFGTAEQGDFIAATNEKYTLDSMGRLVFNCNNFTVPESINFLIPVNCTGVWIYAHGDVAINSNIKTTGRGLPKTSFIENYPTSVKYSSEKMVTIPFKGSVSSKGGNGGSCGAAAFNGKTGAAKAGGTAVTPPYPATVFSSAHAAYGSGASAYNIYYRKANTSVTTVSGGSVGTEKFSLPSCPIIIICRGNVTVKDNILLSTKGVDGVAAENGGSGKKEESDTYLGVFSGRGGDGFKPPASSSAIIVISKIFDNQRAFEIGVGNSISCGNGTNGTDYSYNSGWYGNKGYGGTGGSSSATSGPDPIVINLREVYNG